MKIAFDESEIEYNEMPGDFRIELMGDEGIKSALDEIVNRCGEILEYIEITIYGNEHFNELVLSASYYRWDVGFRCPYIVIGKYYKYKGWEYVEDITLKQAQKDGRRIYFQFRNQYKLKRDLGIREWHL